MKRLQVLLIPAILLLLTFLLTPNQGCKKKSQCTEDKEAPVTEVIAPSTGHINENIAVIVSFGIANGCGKFNSLQASSGGNVITITPIVHFEGCICTMIYSIQSSTYTFTASSAGSYTLRFPKGDGDFIEHIIVIN